MARLVVIVGLVVHPLLSAEYTIGCGLYHLAAIPLASRPQQMREYSVYKIELMGSRFTLRNGTDAVYHACRFVDLARI
jgi:hypothetical protein